MKNETKERKKATKYFKAMYQGDAIIPLLKVMEHGKNGLDSLMYDLGRQLVHGTGKPVWP